MSEASVQAALVSDQDPGADHERRLARPFVPGSLALLSEGSLPAASPRRPSSEVLQRLGEQLFPYLAAIPDPRDRRGRRYPLPLLLVLCLVGLCCGCQGYLSIVRWARALNATFREELGFPKGRIPCAATLLNLFRKLDWTAVAAQLHAWVEATGLSPASAVAAAPDPASDDPPWQGFALDGKTLRGSLAAGAEIAHVVSLVVHGLGVSMTEVGVPERQGELTVAPEVLAPVLGPGRVITGDALFTQRDLCRQILNGGSHYLLVVKENQPTLLTEVQQVLGMRTRAEGVAQERRATWTVNIGHGRIENRFLLLATPAAGEVGCPLGAAGSGAGLLPGAAPASEGRRGRSGKRGKSAGGEPREPGARVWDHLPDGDPGRSRDGAAARKGALEYRDQVHYVLDTFFRDDERRITVGAVARGMAALRRGALNLLPCLGGRSIPEASDRAKADPSRILAVIGLPTENCIALAPRRC
jgi:hypothetical protein